MAGRSTIRILTAGLLLAGSLALPQSTPQKPDGQATPPPVPPAQQAQPVPEPPPANPSPYWDASVKLNQMALELQQQVTKSTKDQLAVDVIRKADAIEHGARSIKEKMKGQ